MSTGAAERALVTDLVLDLLLCGGPVRDCLLFVDPLRKHHRVHWKIHVINLCTHMQAILVNRVAQKIVTQDREIRTRSGGSLAQAQRQQFEACC